VDDYDWSTLLELPDLRDPSNEKCLTGFFLATYGEGEPADNSVEFYDWLLDGGGKGEDEEVELDDEWAINRAGKNLHYVMFGLGNKTYEHFNAMGRRVNRRFKNIGGTLVGPYGEGDDDGWYVL
jgi:NADPH-ferrihemoprotein reductase